MLRSAQRRSRASSCAALLAVALLGQSTAAAPPRPEAAKPAPEASQDDRETARAFGLEGYERFEAGDYARAAELFRMAEKRFHAPTHWLYIARAEAKLGRLLEAERAYERVLADELAPGAPKPFVEAQASARSELPALRERIPVMTVEIAGIRPGAPPAVSLDGAPIQADPRGTRLRVEPGKHTIRVTAAGMVPLEQTIEVTEGEARRVPFALQPVPEPPSLLLPGLAFGVGGAGLVVGVVTGVLSLNKVSELDALCPDRRCTPDHEPIGDDARALGTVSTIGFIAGGVFVAAGVTLLVIGPSGGRPADRASASAPRLTASAGPGTLMVRGAF